MTDEANPEGAPPRVHYKARCPTCPWTGRPYKHIAHADDAAEDHATARRHVTYVIDQYDLRVTGTTHRPASASDGSSG